MVYDVDMRERIEDIGRILVLIKNLQEHQIFSEEYLPSRSRDAEEWFDSLHEDKKYDVIRHFCYSLSDLSDKMFDIQMICEGTDYLNDKENI